MKAKPFVISKQLGAAGWTCPGFVDRLTLGIHVMTSDD